MILDDLTVFIVSTGEETLDDCLASLEGQDSSFKIEIIENVCPMSKAFQAMPDRCTTPYFIQVDADMILEPYAVRTLYEGGRNSWFFTVVVYGQLYEEGFGVGGSIRLWKRSLFNFFSFRDRRTVDRDLYNRIKWLGFRRESVDKVLGIHRPRHSVFSTYLKAKSDVEKWRYLKRNAGLYATNLYDETMRGGEPEDYSKLFGLLLGVLTLKERYSASKDLEIEKKRYTDVMKILGHKKDINFASVGVLDHQARQLFIECYNDFYNACKHKRELLAKILICEFADDTNQAVNIKEFLELVSS